MTHDITLNDALNREYQDMIANQDIESMMLNMLGEYKNETNEQTDVRDIYEEREHIRKLMIVTKFLSKEKEELEEMKKRVMQSWDDRIKTKADEITKIRQYIQNFINTQNNGEALEFELGKASPKVTAPTIRLKALKKDEEEALMKQLEEQKILHHFSKVSLDNKALLDSFKEQIKNEAALKTAEEVAQLKAAGQKVTKTKEKELLKKHNEEAFERNREKLPSYIEYVEPTSSLMLTFKK